MLRGNLTDRNLRHHTAGFRLQTYLGLPALVVLVVVVDDDNDNYDHEWMNE